MSVEKAFLDSLGLSFHKGQNHSLLLSYNQDHKQGPPSLAHLTAKEYTNKSYVSKEIFDSYFKFAFIRNPWSRMVSIYKYFNYHRVLSLENFIRFKFEALQEERNYFLMPQTNYLYNENGDQLVDFIGRFENFENDFDRVRKQISFPVSRLLHINKTQNFHNWYSRWNLKFVFKNIKKDPVLLKNLSLNQGNFTNYTDYYSSDAFQMVYDIYRTDIEKFGYDFGE